jgi:DNA-binding response OmpR family regulator
LTVQVIRLTLNHGVYITRGAQNVSEARAVLGVWRPHLAVIDTDSGGELLVQHLVRDGGSTRTPGLALTRRGDFRAKLAAFEQGVDEIMTIPSSPEELLAYLPRLWLGQSLRRGRTAAGTGAPLPPR